jgi:hypothetical protein
MPDIPVLVLVEEQRGLVKKGATETYAHAGAGTVVGKVVNLGSEKLVAGLKKMAEDIGPSLTAGLKELSAKIAISEVSLGCAINAEGGIVVAGVGAEASLTITFKVA